MHLVLTGHDLLGDGRVVQRPVDGRGQQHGPELGFMDLSVAVDTPVALLDPDQTPRQVPVQEVVTLPVQVHALRGAVTGQQDTYVGARAGELVDEFLLLGVRCRATEHGPHRRRGRLLRLPPEERRQDRAEPLQSFVTLGEHHRAGRTARAHADPPQLGDQSRQLGGGRRPCGGGQLVDGRSLDRPGQVGQPQQGRHLADSPFGPCVRALDPVLPLRQLRTAFGEAGS